MMFFPDMSDEDYEDFGYEDYLDEDYYDDFDDVSYSDESGDESRLYMDKESNQKQHCIKLVEGLNVDRRSGEMCDGVINVDGKEFLVHRVVLTVASPYFRAMFAGSFKESQQKRIDLKDVNKDAFEVVLNYVYGETDQITEENLQEVYECADMLCIDHVLKECKDFLRFKCLSMKDKLAAYVLANRMELVDTMDALVNHFYQEFDKIVKEPYFLELPFEVLNKLIEKKFASSCLIDPAVHAVILWVTHKLDTRFPMAEKLLNEIHLDQVTNTTTEELTLALSNVHFKDKSSAESRDALISKIKSNSMVVRKKLNDLQLKLRCLWINRLDIEFAEFDYSTWDWTNQSSGVRQKPEHFFVEDFLDRKQPKFVTEELQAVVMTKEEAIMFGSSTVLVYNFAGCTTRVLAQLPKPRTNFCVVAHESSIIVVGGGEQDMLRYDWFSNSWVTISSWFNPKNNAAVVVHDGIMYMMGGYNNKRTSTTNYCISYNFLNRRFIRLAKLNRRIHNPHIAAFGKMLYLFGQDLPLDFIAAIFRPKEVVLCQVYDIQKKAWSESSLKISSDETVLDVKTVKEGILVIFLRREGQNGKKLTVSLFKPHENSLQYVGCLPLPKDDGVFSSKYFFADVC